MDPNLMWGGMPQTQQMPDSPYPTFPNAGGFGSQQGYQGAFASGGTPQGPTISMGQGQPAVSPYPGSQSFNPWDLQGPANARGA